MLDFGDWGISMEMSIPAIIIGVSSISLFYGLTMVIQRHTHLDLSAIDELIQNPTRLKLGVISQGAMLLGWQWRALEMIMPAKIIDVSRISLFCSHKVGIQRYNLDTSSNR